MPLPPPVLASAVIAFAAGGLWEKYSVAVSQPTVDFTYDMVVVLEGDASAGGGERVWTTSAAMNAALGPRLLAASVQVAADDENNDGKKDVFDIVWRGYGARAVTGVKVLTQVRGQGQWLVGAVVGSTDSRRRGAVVGTGQGQGQGSTVVLQTRGKASGRGRNGTYLPMRGWSFTRVPDHISLTVVARSTSTRSTTRSACRCTRWPMRNTRVPRPAVAPTSTGSCAWCRTWCRQPRQCGEGAQGGG